MATLEKYLNQSPAGQLLIEICLFLQDRTSTTELAAIGHMSLDAEIRNLSAVFSTADINSCAIDRFLVYRYAAIESLDFNKEEIFFHALKKQYFKSLCFGFYKYAKERKMNYSWAWTEHFQVMGNLMKLYVFDEDFINSSELLKSYFERVKLDERWMLSDKILGKLYLKGLDIEKFQRIPFMKIRMELLEEAFNFFYYQMKVPSTFTDFLIDRMHQVRSPGTLQRLTHTLMFKNDIEGLNKMVQNAPNHYVLSLAQAHLHFMKGEFDEALSEFEINQQLLKKIEGQKRIPFSTSYCLQGLCLLYKKADTATWDNYWKALYKDGMTSSFLGVSLGILSNNAKMELVNEWSKTSDDYIMKNSALFSIVFLGYTSFWLGRPALARQFFSNVNIAEIRRNYPWVNTELNVLAHLLAGQEDYDEDNAVLLKIHAPKPEWETLLEHMDKIMGDYGSHGSEVKEERVFWRFSPEKLELDAIIQKQNSKTGTWSKGRVVTWSKMEDPEIQKQLTDQDKEIVRCYLKIINSTDYRYYVKKDPELAADLLEKLIGHPYLYLMGSSDTPMQISRAKLELRLLRSEKGYQFENPYKDSTVSYTYIFKRETATRYSYIRLNKEQQQMMMLLDKKKITVPNRAEEQLKHTIKKLVSIMPVHSDLEIEDSNIPEHHNDQRIYVHIVPMGELFQVELFVKPFGEAPPYFSPGSGHERILSDLNGQTVFVQRDLKKEKESAEMLIASSEMLNMDNVDSGIWTLDSIEQCLMLLSELNELRKEDKIVLEWPQGEKLRISGYASFDSLFMKVRSSGNWFEIEGELRVNDETLLDMQLLLERSRDSKNRFLALDDGSFLALTEQLYNRLKEMDSWTQKLKNKLMVSQFAGAAISELSEDINIVGDQGWNSFIKRMDEAKDKDFELPTTLQATLRPYQQDGYLWLCRMSWWGAGACLADDMGLGKTVQTIALLIHRASEGPALVVAPASVCANWISELERFAPSLSAVNLSQSQDRIQSIEQITKGQVLVTTYGLLHQASEALCAKKFGTIVLDEAQSIKNRFTKRSQAAMDLQGDFKVITTGTPMENHLGELWNLFHFINPGLLGTAQQFQERFALPIEKWGDKEKREQLQKLIKPFILRRLKKEVLKDLPDKTEITLTIERSDAETAFYEALRRKALEAIQGGKFENEGAKQMQVLAELMRLRRCCCHPSLIKGGDKIPSAKLDALSDLIDELLENGHKALIFSQFVDYLRIIEKMIQKKGISYQYLDGSTPLKKRKIAVDAFQDGDGDLFLISLKAGGTGLNLTAADYVIHVDPWWNPAVEDQASDRAHRIGQLNPVTVYRLVAEGSIEEKIVRLHATKREMAEALLQDTDGKARMNAADLLDLLKEGF